MKARKYRLRILLFMMAAVLLIVYVMATAFIDDKAPVTDVTPPESPVKITFWSIETKDQRQASLVRSIQSFNQSHNNIQIVPYYYETEAYKTKLKVAMVSGKMPDLFYYWTGESFKYMVDSQIVADITELLQQKPEFKKQFYPEALQSATYYDRVYGVPHSTSHVLIWYNKRIFAEHSITPPDTWEELLKVVDLLTEKRISPIAVSGKERWPLLHWYAYLANRLGGTSPFQRALKKAGDFTDPGFVDASVLFRDLVEKKAFIPGFLGLDLPAAQRAFLSGDAAMYLQGDWATELLLRNGEIGYFPFPTVNGKGDRTVYYGGYSSGWAISARSNRQAAFEVLNYLLSSNEWKKFVEASGSPSTIKDLPISKSSMNPSVYEYQQFISKESSDYFGFYDQEIDPRRAEQLLDAVMTMAGTQSMSRKEIEEILAHIR